MVTGDPPCSVGALRLPGRLPCVVANFLQPAREDPDMASVTEKWRTERFSAAVYDAAVEHERVARVAGSAMWAADTRKLFAYIARAAGMPAGSSILDVPCGGGLGFRGLRPGQDVRYVAADISPYMLQRARKEARHRHVEDQIEFVAGDITALEFPAVSYTHLTLPTILR